MNSTIYVFGNLAGRYVQSCDDYTRDIFLRFYNMSANPIQVIIHRDKDLMYYGYIRKLYAAQEYIGFCVVFNGVMLTQISRLFSVFDIAVSQLIANKKILQYETQQYLTAKECSSTELRLEFEHITSFIQAQVAFLENGMQKLPPVNYSKDNTTTISYSDTDKDEDIVSASHSYGYTYISKSCETTPDLTKNDNTDSKVQSSPPASQAIPTQKENNTEISDGFIIWIGIVILGVAFMIAMIAQNS